MLFTGKIPMFPISLGGIGTLIVPCGSVTETISPKTVEGNVGKGSVLTVTHIFSKEAGLFITIM